MASPDDPQVPLESAESVRNQLALESAGLSLLLQSGALTPSRASGLEVLGDGKTC